MKDLIANQLVKYLEARGVEHIFGLCGHTNIAVLAALSKSKKIKFINTRHEQIAAHAADGYARATARRRCVLSHLVARAHQRGDRCGQRRARLDPDGGDRRRRADALLRQAPAPGSEPARGRVAIRDLPAVRQARVARGSAHLFPEIIEKAFTLAESGRPGPVLVDVPMDIFSKEIDVALFERLRHNAKALHKPSLDEETAEKIVRQLLAAKTPLLYVGGGILLADAATEMRELAEHLSAARRAHADGQGRAARRPSARSSA